MDNNGEKNFKTVHFVVDSMDMFCFKRDFIRQEKNELFCDGQYIKDSKDEECAVKFQVDKTYEIFSMMQNYWGDWNDCPDCISMKNQAQKWYKQYGAELIRIAHDSLEFQCERTLTEKEMETLIKEITAFAPNSLDIADYDSIKKRLTDERTFVLWWD